MATKQTYKIVLIVAALTLLVTGMAMYFGALSFQFIPPDGETTTTTTTDTTGDAVPSDFFTDIHMSGNVDEATGANKDANSERFPFAANAKLKFTENDFLSKAAVSGSGTIQVYDYNSEEILETLTFSSGTITGTKYYTSGQHLKFELTESGYVNYFGAFTVPWTNDQDITTLEFTVYIVDIPTWEQSCQFANETAIADAGTLNVTTDLTGGLAELIFKNSHTTDDDGYASSYDFLKNVWRNAYFFVHFTGTGTDSVIISSADESYERVVVAADNDVWVFWKLSDDDLSRDLHPDGVTRDPTGRWDMGITLELSGITSGDSVTCTYGITYNADSSYLRTYNQWFPQAGNTEVVDTLVIAP
jgi:hypothetical protein